MFNQIRMRHIRCFLAVARAGSVTHAARVLNSSQPAVSRTLAEIEEIIGQPLFDRTGRGLRLTEAGQRLSRHFDIALTQIETGAAAASGGGANARVAFGLLPNVARTVAVDAVGSFKAAYPETDIALHWAGVIELIAKMARGDLDFILGRLLSPEHLQGVTFEQLYTEELLFVAHHTHPLAQPGAHPMLVDFEDQLMIVPLSDTIIWREMDKFLRARGIPPFANQIETVSFEFTRTFLRHNMAVACLPKGAIRRELSEGTLVDLGIRGDELMSSVGLSFMRDRDLSPEAELLAQHVRAASQQFHDIPERL